MPSRQFSLEAWEMLVEDIKLAITHASRYRIECGENGDVTVAVIHAAHGVLGAVLIDTRVNA